MAFFEGEYVNKIDGKGRTSLPASFRAELEGSEFKGIVLFKSLEDNCFIGSDLEYLKNLFYRVSRQFGPNSPQMKSFRRNVINKSKRLSVDMDGRMVMPKALQDEIGLTGQILYAGGGDRFEIWNPESFEAAFDGDVNETLEVWNSLEPDQSPVSIDDIFGGRK